MLPRTCCIWLNIIYSISRGQRSFADLKNQLNSNDPSSYDKKNLNTNSAQVNAQQLNQQQLNQQQQQRQMRPPVIPDMFRSANQHNNYQSPTQEQYEAFRQNQINAQHQSLQNARSQVNISANINDIISDDNNNQLDIIDHSDITSSDTSNVKIAKKRKNKKQNSN